MNDNGYLLEFSTRLAYSIPGISDDQELYWNKITRIIFLDTLSDNQLLHLLNKAAVSPFGKNESLLKEAADKLNDDQKSTSLALLKLVRDHVAEKDAIKAKLIDRFINDIQVLIGARDDEAIEKFKQTLSEKILSYDNRPTIRIPFSLWLASLDYGLRWLILIVLGAEYAGEANVYLVYIMIVVTWFFRRRQRKKHTALFDQYGGVQQFKVRYDVTALQYTILACYIVSGAYISYLIVPDLSATFVAGVFIILYFINIRFFPLGKLDESILSEQISQSNEQRKNFDPDENDEAIVSTESHLTAVTGRLDAYVLESALFGALAFSGFLQVISEELVGFSQLEKFVAQVSDASRAFVLFDWEKLSVASAHLESTQNLLCLIAIETLICSVFFLAVIASRLRFSNVADRVREAINQANAFNVKEEAALEHSNDRSHERLGALNEKVNSFLAKASRAMEEVHPVMGYMEYFRNAGILTFLLLLVSSGLFISNTLALAFVFLGVATLIYFNRESISLLNRRAYQRFRMLLSRWSTVFPWLVIGFMIIAFMLRTAFGVMQTDGLLAVGLFLLTLYVFSWIVFIPHHDPVYGDVMRSGKDEWRDTRWVLIRNVLGICVLMIGIGYIFKKAHLTGADELMMTGMSLFTITFIFAGYYLAKKRWVGIILAWLMATGLIGMLFTVLNLQGAMQMVLVGETFQIIVAILLLFTRRHFHIFFIKIFIFIFIFNTFYLVGVSNRISLAYEHATLSLAEVNRLAEIHDGFLADDPRSASGTRPDTLTTGTVTQHKIAAGSVYQKKYGTQFGYTSVYRQIQEEDYWFVYDLLQKVPRDTAALESAMPAARQVTVIDSLFSYSTGRRKINFVIEPKLLYALGQNDKAILLLRRVIASDAAPELKAKAEEMIQAIARGSLSVE